MDGGESYTFAIRATHQFLIPEDTYTLLGSSERVKHADIDRIRRQYWAVGRRVPDGRFEKVSVVVMDDEEDVTKLKERYNVNRILGPIKAYPTESMAGASDHLLISFFNEDTPIQPRVVRRWNVGSNPEAALGHWARQTPVRHDGPDNVEGKDALEIISQYGVLRSWIFDSPKRIAAMCYLDMHEAFQARFTVSNQIFVLIVSVTGLEWI
ncbi:hypothetical protein F5146DRAFT_1005867 [Armillaria mellea]|nr:hypothetical protein F5146DRAFT_1005867 [Armillaria mellea]